MRTSDRRRLSPLRLMRASRDAAIDLLFPPVCNFCGEAIERSDGGAILCLGCTGRLRPELDAVCPRCAAPCPKIPSADGECPSCRGAKYAFSAVRTLGLYAGDLRSAVLQMKHPEHEPLAMAIGRQLADVLLASPFPAPIDLVAPVPMHWLKRLWRGANPAETLAAALAREARLQVAADLVRCRRLLKKQATLLPGERFQNVRNAYRVSRSFDIRGATVLVVDDVVTTGASADAVGKALRRAGAADVFVIAAARGTGHR